MATILDSDMPIGLKMALAENVNAMKRFTELPESGQRSFIQGARNVNSSQGMEAHVNSLLQG